jgi:hypothetical protein
MAEFDLELHPDKTRLIEFGRHAASDRAERGDGKPKTFNFLDFTHICSRSRRGGFMLGRHTRRDRKQAKLLEVTEDLRRRCHQDVTEQGRWLGGVVRGFFAYHAVPTNSCALSAFRHHVVELWRRVLRRRQPEGSDVVDGHGQTGGSVASQDPDNPSLAFSAIPRQTPKVGAVCGNSARTVLRGGCSVMGVPAAIKSTLYMQA